MEPDFLSMTDSPSEPVASSSGSEWSVVVYLRTIVSLGRQGIGVSEGISVAKVMPDLQTYAKMMSGSIAALK